MVREHGDAVDALELAANIGLHVTTVRFHLDSLCDEGAIVRTRLPRVGKGRPRTGYRAAQQQVDYRILAEVLAMELGQNAQTRARRANHAGQKWAARMMTSEQSAPDGAETTPAPDTEDVLDRTAVRTSAAFTGMGFASELVAPTPPMSRRERIIRLHACPVRDLARTHPEVICEIHRGLLEGLVAKTSAEENQRKSRGPVMSARLEPFVEPELCMARLVSGK